LSIVATLQFRREPFSFLNGLHELPTSTSAQQFVKNCVREKYSRRAVDREASNVEMCHRFGRKREDSSSHLDFASFNASSNFSVSWGSRISLGILVDSSRRIASLALAMF